MKGAEVMALVPAAGELGVERLVAERERLVVVASARRREAVPERVRTSRLWRSPA